MKNIVSIINKIATNAPNAPKNELFKTKGLLMKDEVAPTNCIVFIIKRFE